MLNCYIWSTLQSSEHQNDQTQILPSGNPSHERLTLNMEHTTLLYKYLFITHTYFSFQNVHMYLYTQLSRLHIVFMLFCTLPICILLFYYLCPVAVILLHCGTSFSITNSSMCKDTWPIKLILITYHIYCFVTYTVTGTVERTIAVFKTL